MSSTTIVLGQRRARCAAATRGRIPRSMLPAAVAACLCSCSTQPPAVEELFPQPLPFSVSLDLDEMPAALALYGTTDEWRNDILAVLDAARLCHDLRRAGDGGNPDVSVHVAFPAAEEHRTEVDVPSAFVTTIAWSCVPPLHLFVRDVAVFPGVRLTVTLTREAALPDRKIEHQAAVYTSYLQRYPFFSWETLGSILLPSFVFSSGEPKHMLPAIAPRVRADIACAIAREIGGSALRPADDLLRNPRLQRAGEALVLHAEGSADLHMLLLRLDDPDAAAFHTRILPPAPLGGEAAPIAIPLDPAALAGAPRARLLRIQATPRSIGRASERYSLRIDDGAPPAPAAERAK